MTQQLIFALRAFAALALIWVPAALAAPSFRQPASGLNAVGPTLAQTVADRGAVFRNTEFGFRFVYPSNWVPVQPRGANVRGSVNAPAGPNFANCNIVIREAAELRRMSQAQIDRELLTPFSKSDWVELMIEAFPDVRVRENSAVKISNRPAQYAVLSTTYESLNIKTYNLMAVFVTMTPGRLWNFTCGVGATTQSAVEAAFQVRLPDFMGIMRTFVWEE